MQALSYLKYRLSHLSYNALHSKLVDFAFWGHAPRKKACVYWWFAVPASLPGAGIAAICWLIFGIFILFCLIAAFIIIPPIAAIGWVMGYRVRNWTIIGLSGEGSNAKMFETYGRRKPERHMTWSRWAAAVPLFALFVYGFCWFFQIPVGKLHFEWVLTAAVIIGGLSVIGYAFKKAAPFIAKEFNKRCPDIEWAEEA